MIQHPPPPSSDEIKDLRTARGETQVQFARALGIEGSDESARVTVARWETDTRTPNYWYAERIRELASHARGEP
jgi:transcriptional regulator with XRE-family HTH domain